MATKDIFEIYGKLRERKALSFRQFMLGNEGGLDTESLRSASIDCVDIRYKELQMGTKMYVLRPRHTEQRIQVYSLNLETLQTIFKENSCPDEGSSDDVACLGVYKLVNSISTMQIREDIASEVCMLWSKSKDQEKTEETEETDGTDYRKLLDRKFPYAKNFLDYCFTIENFPGDDVEALVYTRQSSTYGVFVKGMKPDQIALRRVQELVVPKSSIGKLTVDLDGYVRLSSLRGEPTHAPLESVDGYAEMKENGAFEESKNSAEAVPSYDDNFPTAEEYNDYKENDHSLDYESIDIRPLPQESSTQVASPRPDQPPPPPPAAEPVYSTIDKSAKKPKARSKSVDQTDMPTTPTGTKPPRPPPLDTMPNSDGESPIQSKPSRPSAPPKIQRSKTQSTMEAGMGSSGNVSLDGKDDSVVPPPRSSQKLKGRQKSESNTRF